MLTKFNEYIRSEHMFAKQLFDFCKVGAGMVRNSNFGCGDRAEIDGK